MVHTYINIRTYAKEKQNFFFLLCKLERIKKVNPKIGFQMSTENAERQLTYLGEGV